MDDAIHDQPVKDTTMCQLQERVLYDGTPGIEPCRRNWNSSRGDKVRAGNIRQQ